MVGGKQLEEGGDDIDDDDNEAVEECWVSIMEHPSSKRRPFGEESMVEEVMIAINGPSVVHSEITLIFWGNQRK